MKKFLLYFALLLFLIALIGKNYLLSSQMPLTEDGHGNLGLAWIFRNSILQDKSLPHWDAVGGSPLGEFHPFPGSYYYTGIIAIFFPDPAIVLKIAIMLAILMAGISMYFLILTFTGNSFGSMLAGLIYAFNPYFLLEGPVTGHINFIFVYMIFPFLLAEFYRAVKFDSKIEAFLVVGIYTVILLSDIQYAFFSSLLFFFFAATLFVLGLLDKKNQPISSRKVAFVFFFVLFFTLLLVSYQAISWLVVKNQVVGQELNLDEIRKYSSSFLAALNLQGDLPQKFHYSLNPLHSWYFVIAFLGFLLGKKPQRYFFAFLYLFALVLVMGLKTPILEMFYRFVPLASYFRVPFRFSFLMVIAITFLVGFIEEKDIKNLFFPRKKFPSQKLVGFSFITLVVFLLLGVFNGPLRWNFFQTFSFSKRNPVAIWIEQPTSEDAVLYNWLKTTPDNYRIGYFNLHPGGIPLSMFGSIFHGRRTFDATQAHVSSQKYLTFIKEINDGQDGEIVAKLTGILNIRYLLQRERGYLLETETFQNDFEQIQIDQGPLIFQNKKVLPFLRTVDFAVLVTGRQASKIGFAIMKDKRFDPRKALIVIDEKKYFEENEIDFLKKFNVLILADVSFKDEQRVKDLLAFYRKDKQVEVCYSVMDSCQFFWEELKKTKNNAVILKDDTFRLSSRYSFEVEVGSKGTWLILSEPYFSNWRVKIDNQVYKTLPAYGVVQAFHLPSDKKISTGSFFYGRSSIQDKALAVSLIAFSIYLLLLILFFFKKLLGRKVNFNEGHN